MNLRVFSNSAGNLLVENSHPRIQCKTKWVLSMLPLDEQLIPFASDGAVIAEFQGKRYTIPFFLIGAMDAGMPHIVLVGCLEESDSRNVLNNILDVLAWD